MAERCAIYFAPPAGTTLAAFGQAWFARADNRTATAAPRHYGFHATLKPPFRFAPDRNLEGLQAELRRFAEVQPAVAVGRLKVSDLSGFLALVPVAAPPALSALAAACVERFDDFRAAPSDGELAKRRAKPLTPRQEDLLRRWGYPYVFDQFRWHMTLTGRLPEAERGRWKQRLQALAAPALAEPLVISELALFRQPDTRAPFEEIDRVALRAAADAQAAGDAAR